MRNATRSGILVALVLVLVGAIVAGCAQFGSLIPQNGNSDEQVSLASSENNFVELAPTANAVASCGLSQLTGDERNSAIQEALSNSKVQTLIQELNSRGYSIFSSAASTYAMDGEKLVWLPAGPSAGIMYQTYLRKGYATGAIKEGEKTLNIQPDNSVRHIFGFDPKTKDKFFKQARSNKQVKALDKTLRTKNQRIEWSQSVLFVDSEGNTVTIGLAIKETNNSNAARFGYRVEANLKGRKLVVQRVKSETCGSVALSETKSPIPVMEDAQAIETGSEAENSVMPTCIPENDLNIAVPNIVCGGTTTTTSPTVTISGTTICSSGAGTTCIIIDSSKSIYRNWYYQYWNTGQFISDEIALYNAVTEAGAYAMGYLWDHSRNVDLLLAGVPGLDEMQINNFWNSLPIRLQEQIQKDTRINRFFELMPIDGNKTDQWMLSLRNAINQGAFEEEYSRLLVEGLNKVQSAVMALLETTNAQQAKQFIMESAKRWTPPMTISTSHWGEPISVQILNIIEKSRQYLRGQWNAWNLIYTGITLIPYADLLSFLTSVLEEYELTGGCGTPFACIDGFSDAWTQAAFIILDSTTPGNFGPQVALQMTQAIEILVLNFRDPGSIFQTACSSCALNQLISTWGLLEWMGDTKITDLERQSRLERGVGTILVAGNSVRNSGLNNSGSWAFHGFYTSQYVVNGKAQKWFGAVMTFLPNVIVSPGGKVSKTLVLAGGDHCQKCASKADEVVEWVAEAIRLINRPTVDGAFYFNGVKIEYDHGMVSFAFTRPGAEGVGIVISALEKRFGSNNGFGGSNIPIIVSWVDPNNQVWFHCIGSVSACNWAVSSGMASTTACNQHGRTSGCGATQGVPPKTLPIIDMVTPPVRLGPTFPEDVTPGLPCRGYLCTAAESHKLQ